jgi:sodium pump decarboxylase gamma subunit
MWTIVIIGISTVFLCLIALVVMVAFFKFIFVRAPKVSPATSAATAKAAQPAPAAKSAGIDGAVVAAIVAAISAASGVSASSLRIASMERTGFNTPVWGHVDRA